MSHPIPIGIQYDPTKRAPSVSLHEVDKDGHGILVNGKDLTLYLRGVQNLGMLGELLADEDVRYVLYSNHVQIGASAEMMPDRGACLLGYCLLKELYVSPVWLDADLEACYYRFLACEGYARPDTRLPLPDGSQCLRIDTRAMKEIARFLTRDGLGMDQEILLSVSSELGNAKLTITPIHTFQLGRGMEFDIALDDPGTWQEPVRLGIFAAFRFLCYCGEKDALPDEKPLILRYAPAQGTLELRIDGGALRLPALVFTGVPPNAESVASKDVLRSARMARAEARREQKEFKL